MATSSRGLGQLWLLPALLLFALSAGAGRSAALPAILPQADNAPAILAVNPAPNAQGVAFGVSQDGSLTVTFTEPVALSGGALELVCERSELHVLTISGGPSSFAFVSDRPFLPGEDCVASIMPLKVSDLDSDDPPDNPQKQETWSFRTAAEPVIINELDAITAQDSGEFVELYDGGRGDTDLTGLTLVLYGDVEAWVYLAIGLDGYRTDGDGYFVIGDSGVPGGVDLLFASGVLRDGPDAVALYEGQESDFPKHSPVAAIEPLDAAVYGPAGAELLALLLPGQAALNENSRGTAETDSNQRCPNGGGLPRASEPFIQDAPTPGAPNACPVDSAPALVAVQPAPGAVNVAVDSIPAVEFNEPVLLNTNPIEIACTISGNHTYTVSGAGHAYQFSPVQPFAPGELCEVTIFADRVTDSDDQDPPDHPANNYVWSFHTIAPVAENVVINEVDSDTPGVDTAEFIELYDGGAGHTSLNGLSIVLFNGGSDTSYLTVELDGYSTNGAGYFLLANAAVAGRDITLPNSVLQNGPDAVALVAGGALDYPNGTAVAATVPRDAFVYGSPAQYDPGLQPLLNPGQPQVDENGRGDANAHSNQRCPNGQGGPRNTTGYKQNTPTPKAANDCITDAAPAVKVVSPAPNATGIGIHSGLVVEFSEPVKVTNGWITLTCGASGTHTLSWTGGPSVYALESTKPFAYSETCTATVKAALVNDLDTDDPPDTMAQGMSWSFTTAAPPGFILINELDPDTPDSDTAEFIELYDGGAGHTDLSGLIMVFWNGGNDKSYRTIDLAGYQTDADGYLVVGNAAVPGVDLAFANGTLQNGPDAVGLYARQAADFPNGSSLTTAGLIDAVVYGPTGEKDVGLLTLLEPGQPQVDETSRGAGTTHSLQRCPNGAGGQRRTAAFQPDVPTPGAKNSCTVDAPPAITEVIPPGGSVNVANNAVLKITFSEEVAVASGWFTIQCQTSGGHPAAISGGPQQFTLAPVKPFSSGETCTVTLQATKISDADSDDPPDSLPADYQWSFHTASPPPGTTPTSTSTPPPSTSTVIPSPTVVPSSTPTPTAPSSLVAYFTTNGPLWIGETAVITNTSHGPGPLSFQWDFGDGSPPTSEAQPRHDYRAPGLYTITLTVMSQTLKASYSATIEIRPRLLHMPVISGK